MAKLTAPRGDIEGLRAIAVASVVLYHVKAALLPGGFAGVDVFFVLSGFLITLHLVKESARTGGVDLASFYARRARRLLPAASLVLVVTAIAGYFIVPATVRGQLGIDVMAATLYCVNWVFAARSVDYLANDVDAIPSAVQHYWSLSVEEQFYLVWPLLIVGALWAARRGGWGSRRVLFGVLSTVFVASLATSIYLTSTDPARAYFITTTRIWELCVGGLLALGARWLAPRLGPRLAQVMALVGLVAVVASMVVMSKWTPWPGVAALVPTVGAALVVAAGCAPHPTLVGRALGIAPLRWLGGISYAVYLWHWPLFVFLSLLHPAHTARDAALVAALSVLLAWLTKKFVEDPLRFSPMFGTRRASFGLAAVAMALSLTAGAVVWSQRPVRADVVRPDPVAGLSSPTATPTPTPTPTPTSAAVIPPPFPPRVGPMAFADVNSVDAAALTLIADPASAWNVSGTLKPTPAQTALDVPQIYADKCQPTSGPPLTRCVYGNPNSTKRVVLLGDSKAGQWFSAIQAIALRENWRLEVLLLSQCALSDTPLTREDGTPFTDCHTWGRAAINLLKKNPPALVIYSHGWALGQESTAHVTGAFAPLRGKTQLMFVEDSLSRGQDNVEQCLGQHRTNYLACTYERTPGGGTAVLKSSAAALGAHFVSAMDWVCPPTLDRCAYAAGGVPIYRQGTHLTDTYAAWLAPVFHRELRAMGIATTPPMPIAS